MDYGISIMGIYIYIYFFFLHTRDLTLQFDLNDFFF